jgi:hypothetical protein
MFKPFDVAMRDIYGIEPAAWPEFLGFPIPSPELIEVIESNLSTIADADKILRIGGPSPFILHLEFLSGRDKGYPEQALWYNTLAGHKYGLPVWSVLVLLRPAADGPELTGEYEKEVPGRGRNLWFRYDVGRVWEIPPERLLTAGLPLVPLAPVSAVLPERLPEVLTAVAQRLRDEAAPEVIKTLWLATTILTALRYQRDQIRGLIEGIATMILGIRGIEESWVYQDILAEGELKEARKILLTWGRKKLGQPDEQVLARIAALSDLEYLNLLLDRLFDASSWEELLAATGT